MKSITKFTLVAVALFCGPAVLSQPSGDRTPRGEGRPPFERGPFGPGGPNGPGGFGRGTGFGGVQEDLKLVKQFDQNKDKWLNAEERKAAREFVRKERAEGRGPRRPGFGRGRPASDEAREPGEKISPDEVKTYPDAPVYDLKTLRTFFLDFENADWEQELSDFYRTDVEVPATLMVDGKTYKQVGVHFRGASSFFMVAEGEKKSLNLSVDYIYEDQNIGGYRTFNLLNSHTDPTYLRTILYFQIAREYIPAPKANFARVVINGESWGIFINAQQYNKDFINDWFGSTKGARWKVPGSPRGNGGLTYLGEDPAEYKKLYEIKTKSDPKSWTDLIRLCRVLNQTVPEKLEEELSPLLNIEGALKFLALENVLINNDGYWIRSSDFNIYQDENGKFHIIPHDANETFRAPGGPGFGFGPRDGGRRGVELDPLTGASDPEKPLLSKLLAVPSLRAKYLGYVRHIAENWLDWKKIQPLAEEYQALIAEDVKADTRKLDSFEAFKNGVSSDVVAMEAPGFRGPRQPMSLKSFVEQRRAFLLDHPEVKNAPLPKS